MIRVMIVDHSAAVRSLLGTALRSWRDILVIATAGSPSEAWEKMQRQWPDVLLLDTEAPDADAVTFLRQLMSRRPTATVVLSALDGDGAERCLHALDAGALGVFMRPDPAQAALEAEQIDELLGGVRAAAAANLRQVLFCRPTHRATHEPAPECAHDGAEVIVLGARTGGFQALERMLPRLPAGTPPMVVVLQIPARFTRHYAERLALRCRVAVREGRDGDRLHRGLVLIAPGRQHITLARDSDGYLVRLSDAPRLHGHRPSIDLLFHSAAAVAGEAALGALLTGMGPDGVSGLQSLREAGAVTLVQDEASSVVFDTAAEAIRQDAAQHRLSLDALPARLIGRHHVG